MNKMVWGRRRRSRGAPAVTSTRSPVADKFMAMDNSARLLGESARAETIQTRGRSCGLDRAGRAARHLAHGGRDPLAAADPRAGLPHLRRRARGCRIERGDLERAVLLRGAGDELPLRQLLSPRDALEDRLRDLRHG